MSYKPKLRYLLKWRLKSDPEVEYQSALSSREMVDQMSNEVRRYSLQSLKLQTFSHSHQTGIFQFEVEMAI